MKPEKLSNLKKELNERSLHELREICLHLAKYKKENKEYLNYLLFDSRDPMKYAEEVKTFLLDDFKGLNNHYYHSTKSMRKIIRTMTKHAKYTGSKQVEIELSLWFCNNFLKYVDLTTNYRPMYSLLSSQFGKIMKLIPKLHEDLQFDYQKEFEIVFQNASKQTL